ncbi:MAG TPA: AAA family ATPase, partial [Planctomycetaceae bacterium]|nr:AAA family ATPase [Planctomycetaceae bacterium]
MAEGAAKNVLLTGRPGCGKTTVVRQVLGRLGDRRVAGFFTQELREGDRRVGFEAVGLGGMRVVLAHVRLRSAQRVGRYGVAVAEFEKFLQAELDWQAGAVDLVVIDEIGKMECLSHRF